VKVHGYRVELGEIEAALRAHEKVHEAVVLLREDQLVAWVAPEEADAAALREHLKARLPQYMVPSQIGCMARLPLTPNGKVDRQALAALSIEKQRLPSIEPRTETEKALAEIWRELLECEVGITDDVFDLGAHSLMAMKALTRVRERFQVSLSLRNLFEHPTIAGLAEVVDSLWLAQPKTPRPAQGAQEEFVL
jgi:acyl carrier protein